MSRPPRILVAGIGNVFLGDDGFGVEVVARLAGRPQPEGVEVADFGIRGFDLAYALMDGYDCAILVDALSRGGSAGELFLLEPDLAQLESHGVADGHSMNPVAVLRLVKEFGGDPPELYVVGCEPASLGGEEGEMGLSEAVAVAVDPAVEMVEALAGRLLGRLEVGSEKR
ncbi:MAG: hydrogenase maturation protease [Acidimicrobiia bacterium]|nr:hydrogenase maturation protease [Acidimicrobiia bacterium]